MCYSNSDLFNESMEAERAFRINQERLRLRREERLRREAAGYAAVMRDELGLTESQRCSDLPTLVSRQLSWVELRFSPLAAPEGRQDALLCPRAGGGFVIVVDPRPSPLDRDLLDSRGVSNLDDVIDHRIAHELGHTHFFTREWPAVRRQPWSSAEETWADAFAAALLS